eukprot:CAMPEP_0179051566 /NCGR_PEP_ID=MMETSP0796-20121207/21311_1 /TAXON_ID=73915 /ORGANISM="Pyrodinium bahamense, Strain pbaha01" /LENGTH=615 /DNA_ID=CAMNT_0020748111 /DNA_START=67 /DNA_END=1914 /DNA_ORIENTATION=+
MAGEDGIPAQVRVVSRLVSTRGVYVRVLHDLPPGVEGPVFKRIASSQAAKTFFLFKDSGRWNLGPEVTSNGVALCSSAPDEADDPSKMTEQAQTSDWAKTVQRIVALSESGEGNAGAPPARLEVWSELKDLHTGLRKKLDGERVYWASDSGDRFLWRDEAEDLWRLTEGPPDRLEGQASLASAQASGRQDPRLAPWGEATRGAITHISEVWWDENARPGESLFRDASFPHSYQSVGQQAKDLGFEVEWIPVRDLDRDPSNEVLFHTVEPSDLVQGHLGRCWLLAALAAVAEFPEIVEAAFPNRRETVPAIGRYIVKLYDVCRDSWVELAVDEFVPCKKREWFEMHATPIFSNPIGHEVWALVLEKALAKMLGSYSKLQDGHAMIAWQALTGVLEQRIFSRPSTGEWEEYTVDVPAQIEERRLGRVTEPPLEREEDNATFRHDDFWLRLTRWGSDHALAATIADLQANCFALPNGLVPNHAYCIHQVRSLEGFRMLQLRSPWGSSLVWNGAWSNEDAAWRNNPKVKQELGSLSQADGTFWMEFADFAAEFNTVNLCPRRSRPTASFSATTTLCTNNSDIIDRGSLSWSAMASDGHFDQRQGGDRCSDRCVNDCIIS